MRAILSVRLRGGEPLDIPIGNTATIGRSPDNTVALTSSPLVSRQHAIVRCHNAFQYQIMDLGSRNGTFVNGRRVITPTTLSPGAIIRVTDVEIVFNPVEDAPVSGGGFDVTLAAGTDTTGQESLVASIMVCDIRGFSTLSEKLAEDVLARTLGEWFRDAGNIITAGGGTIDKFIGDAILAYWVCEAQPTADAAFSTAESLIQRAMTKTWPDKETPFRIAVALHHGGVTSGNIGLVAQRDATIIGDAVNTTFRIESAMKPLGQILAISGDFRNALTSPPADLASLGDHMLKGKNIPVRLYGRPGPASG
ncbi:MAG: hypothetical protein Fur0032_09460 [Terrimicrobiaceae bacterium]